MKTMIKYPPISDLNVTRYSKIISTGSYLPDNIVTNEDIIKRYNLIATDRAVRYSIGISERRWENKNLDVADCIAFAAKQCLDRANISIEQVDRIIYSKLLGDYNVPATSIGMLKKLKAKKGIPAFDLTAACSGFIHAMDMAIRYIDSGDDYVLILGGGLTSWALANDFNKIDTRTVFLMGDGIAAMLLGVSKEKHFLCSYLQTDNSHYEVGYMPLGLSLLNSKESLSSDMFGMKIDNGRILNENAIESAVVTVERLLESSKLTIDDIDFVATSDQTTQLWEGQLKALNIPLEKSVSLFHKQGNTASAMSPLNLDELIITGRLRRGMTVLMMAHGAGASGGGVIFKY